MQPQQDLQPPMVEAGKFTMFAGVIMPAISITLEATTHITAEVFFDPIPTAWHLAAVIFVPLAQLQVWFAIRRNDPNRLQLAGIFNAIAFGISIFYSIVYLPLVPLAALTLLVGLGLLPLTPYLSLLAALFMRRKLRRLATAAPKRPFSLGIHGLAAGLGLTLLILVLIELPATLTRIGLQMAVSASAEKRAEGIRFLRSYGSKEYLLRSCYSQTGKATDVIGGVFEIRSPVLPSEAQEIYYRVTGETFDASVPPRRVGANLLPGDTTDFDRNQGEATVGAKIEGLTLKSSRIEGNVDEDGGVAYLEWTLVFRNYSPVQQEARTEIQLPPGAVVSRLNLWVNDEEREAAFAGRAKVTQAYQQVVQKRRDPVLVTTLGRDRVLVQCFPVQPYAGEMKIRLGITAPVVLEDWGLARLLLPHFVRRNFVVPGQVPHDVLLTTTRPWSSAENVYLKSERTNRGYPVAGEIPDRILGTPETSIRLSRQQPEGGIWSRNSFELGTVIRQSVEEHTPAHLRRIVLVVDTSASMKGTAEQINEALKVLPADIDFKLVLADGEWLTQSAVNDNIALDLESARTTLRRAVFEGGADNAPALTKAWDFAAEAPGNNAIVWVHNPQPLQLESVDLLKRRWELRPYGPLLYSVQATNGSDEIEKKLDGINEVKSVVRLGSLRSDLEILFNQLSGQVKTLEFVRSLKHDAPRGGGSGAGYETSEHLANLWANDEVARILSARDNNLAASATTLATTYHVVTPVSGAVVLETEQQYRDAGLKPVDAGTVPTIPEPQIVTLMIFAGLFLLSLLILKFTKSRSRCHIP